MFKVNNKDTWTTWRRWRSAVFIVFIVIYFTPFCSVPITYFKQVIACWDEKQIRF